MSICTSPRRVLTPLLQCTPMDHHGQLVNFTALYRQQGAYPWCCVPKTENAKNTRRFTLNLLELDFKLSIEFSMYNRIEFSRGQKYKRKSNRGMVSCLKHSARRWTAKSTITSVAFFSWWVVNLPHSSSRGWGSISPPELEIRTYSSGICVETPQ